MSIYAYAVKTTERRGGDSSIKCGSDKGGSNRGGNSCKEVGGSNNNKGNGEPGKEIGFVMANRADVASGNEKMMTKIKK